MLKNDEVFLLSKNLAIELSLKYASYYGKSVSTPLNKILFDENISLEYYPFRVDRFCGLLYRNKTGQFTILVNANHHKKKQNFTIAHELGHYFLHRNHAYSFFDSIGSMQTNVNSIIEKQANLFASELLLPGHIIDKIRTEGKTVEEITNLFNISRDCLKWRLVRYYIEEQYMKYEKALGHVEQLFKNNKVS